MDFSGLSREGLYLPRFIYRIALLIKWIKDIFNFLFRILQVFFGFSNISHVTNVG